MPWGFQSWRDSKNFYAAAHPFVSVSVWRSSSHCTRSPLASFFCALRLIVQLEKNTSFVFVSCLWQFRDPYSSYAKNFVNKLRSRDLLLDRHRNLERNNIYYWLALLLNCQKSIMPEITTTTMKNDNVLSQIQNLAQIILSIFWHFAFLAYCVRTVTRCYFTVPHATE